MPQNKEQEFGSQLFGFKRADVLNYIDRMHASSLKMVEGLETELADLQVKHAQLDTQLSAKLSQTEKEHDEILSEAQNLYTQLIAEQEVTQKLTERQERLVANLRRMQEQAFKYEKELKNLQKERDELELQLNSEGEAKKELLKKQEALGAAVKELYERLQEQEGELEALRNEKQFAAGALQVEQTKNKQLSAKHERLLIGLRELHAKNQLQETEIASLGKQHTVLQNALADEQERNTRLDKTQKTMQQNLLIAQAAAESKEQEIKRLAQQRKQLEELVRLNANTPGGVELQAQLAAQAQAIGEYLTGLRGTLEKVEVELDTAYNTLQTVAAQFEGTAKEIEDKIGVLDMQSKKRRGHYTAQGQAPVPAVLSLEHALRAHKGKAGKRPVRVPKYGDQEQPGSELGFEENVRTQKEILADIAKILQ